MKSRDAIVLLSGGLDSAIAAAYLAAKGHTVKAGVFVQRGQSNYEQEAASVRKVSEYLRFPLYSASFLLSDLAKVMAPEARKKFGVPARNLILAGIALPYAAALGCDMLALGNIISDDFPDCNAKFRAEFSLAAAQALGRPFDVVAPLADWEGWDKADEIAWAAMSGNAHLFGMTWTCWMGGETHCGVCDACEGRKEGFARALIADAITYGGK